MGKFNAKKAKKELDALWSRQIRKRDRICRKCKKAVASQAAHIFSRGNLSTRWIVENGIGMCYFCHIIWSHRAPVEFTEWVQGEISAEMFANLRKLAHTSYDSSNLKADYERLKIELALEK